MASIVAKRPIVGVAAGIIFAALGSLLISVKGRGQGTGGILGGMYSVAGYFMLLVACLSMVAGVAGLWSLWKARRS